MADDISTNDSIVFYSVEVAIPRQIRFWLLLLLDIPSTVCALFVLCNLLINRSLRQTLNNHVIIVLMVIVLMSNMIDIPAYISFLHFGYVWISTPVFCYVWLFVDIGLFNMIAILMAFATVERHVLVFHHSWVSTRKRRFFIHYIPLCTVVIYDIIFYIYALFFSSCELVVDYDQLWCSIPCFYVIQTLSMYDSIVNCIIPTFLIVIFSILLFLRFVKQKRRLRQGIRWHQCRRMVIQLLLISSLYLIFYLPPIIITTAHLCGLPDEMGAEVQSFAYFFIYFIPLLSPYVCLASLPELWKKVKIHPAVQRLRTEHQHGNIVIRTTNYS